MRIAQRIKNKINRASFANVQIPWLSRYNRSFIKFSCSTNTCSSTNIVEWSSSTSKVIQPKLKKMANLTNHFTKCVFFVVVLISCSINSSIVQSPQQPQQHHQQQQHHQVVQHHNNTQQSVVVTGKQAIYKPIMQQSSSANDCFVCFLQICQNNQHRNKNRKHTSAHHAAKDLRLNTVSCSIIVGIRMAAAHCVRTSVNVVKHFSKRTI